MDRLDIIKRYGEIFLVAVAIIVFYKLFDSMGIFFDAVKVVLSVFTPVVIGGVLAYFLLSIAKL